MPDPLPWTASSGDALADRRYGFALDLAARGDHAAAADLLQQALERAPGFAAAWFALGEARERLREKARAVAAFERALACDPPDAQGAGLRLARLGATQPNGAMTPAYVARLFDQYANRFDAELGALAYRGPVLLTAAVEDACRARGRPFRFRRALDLGCGTGLVGEHLRGAVDHLSGVDLSARMIAQARAKGIYDRLDVCDLAAFLAHGAPACDLVTAADVFVYMADLEPICAAVARVLASGGFFAFTVERADAGVVLGEKLRYAHGEDHVRGALAAAGLGLVALAPVSTRNENRVPAPGLLVVALASRS